MFKTTLLAILAMFVLTPIEATADFYKYIDENGNIIFTDNLSKIPKNQRDKVEKYHEPPPISRSKVSDVDNAQKSDSNDNPKISATDEKMNAKREELEKRRTQLEQEYEVLMKEKTDLERQKAEAKGRDEIKNYNEHVRLFSDKLNKYNEKRMSLETEVTEYNHTIKNK
jgi:chromosome segregation ATPase